MKTAQASQHPLRNCQSLVVGLVLAIINTSKPQQQISFDFYLFKKFYIPTGLFSLECNSLSFISINTA